MQETQVRPFGGKEPLEKELATHCSNLAWEIHGQRSLVGYSPFKKELDLVTKQQEQNGFTAPLLRALAR